MKTAMLHRFTPLALALLIGGGVAHASPATGEPLYTHAEALALADQLDPGFVAMVGQCLSQANHDPQDALTCAHAWMQNEWLASQGANALPTYAQTGDNLIKSSAFLLASVIPGANVIDGNGTDCTSYTVTSSCLKATALVAISDVSGTAADSLAAGICYAFHDLPVVATSITCRAQDGVFVAGGGTFFASTPPFVISRPNILTLEASGVHPAIVSSGSTYVTFDLLIPGCRNCSGLPPTNEPVLPIE